MAHLSRFNACGVGSCTVFLDLSRWLQSHLCSNYAAFSQATSTIVTVVAVSPCRIGGSEFLSPFYNNNLRRVLIFIRCSSEFVSSKLIMGNELVPFFFAYSLLCSE